MQINFIGGSDPTARRSTEPLGRNDLIMGAVGGPLTRSDITMLKKVTGMNFDWPPQEGKWVPAAALDLASYRQEQLRTGAAIKDITSAELQALALIGQMEPDFAAKAREYLTGQRPTTAASTTATDHDGRLYL
ncbi:hypothetical protein [Kineococcus sp. SYSU DK018]|uniref:hypothetical protein n=1 Tax=Kineococcus sp. SYSU DK018 TaxID=3383139 RepID=UPI003D7DAA8E